MAWYRETPFFIQGGEICLAQFEERLRQAFDQGRVAASDQLKEAVLLVGDEPVYLGEPAVDVDMGVPLRVTYEAQHRIGYENVYGINRGNLRMFFQSEDYADFGVRKLYPGKMVRPYVLRCRYWQYFEETI